MAAPLAALAPHRAQMGFPIKATRGATGGGGPYILVGGRPFLDDETLAHRLGADATARDPFAAVERLRERFG